MTLKQRKRDGIQIGITFVVCMLGPCCLIPLMPASSEPTKLDVPAADHVTSSAKQPQSSQIPQPTTTPSNVPTLVASQHVVSVSVVLSQKKSNGKAWDALGGAPDPAICVTTSKGKACYPAMDNNPERIARGMCQDEFECIFDNVEIADEVPFFEVFDADAASHDAAGQGECAVGDTCVIGLATLSIIAAP